MFREFLKNNKKRRIGSMFKKMLSKYVLLLAFLLLIPAKSWGGLTPFTPIPDSDLLGESQLYFPWDLRGRNSFIQVTNVNINNEPVVIHVQVFNHAEDCLETSFWDTLTPNDTNVYDLSAIQDDPDGFGFVVVTEVAGVRSTDATFNFSLIGNFRIIDDAGYEYRANAAAWDPFSAPTSSYTFNFNNRGGAAFSDVIGITVAGAGSGSVVAGNQIAAVFGFDPGFPIITFDDQEVPRDCDVVVFSCGEPNEFFADSLGISTNRINYEFGISAQFPNTKGAAPNICTSSATTGFVFLPFSGFIEGDFFVGFTGLNSGGSSVGSMDLWWADSTFLTTFFNGIQQ
jgi:hypothetical protein